MQEQLKFSDLFKNIKEHLVRTIIITVVIFAIAFSGLFFLSRNSNTYESKFQLYWAGIENDKMLNGTSFDYHKIISLDSLKETKNSDEQFKSIDVDSMYKNNDITIKRDLVLKNENDKEAGYLYNYKINIKKTYFDSKNEAISFISNLIETNTFKAIEHQIDNFSIFDYFQKNDESTEYNEIINQIKIQTSLNKSILENLISKYSSKHIFDFDKNKTLGDLLFEFDSFLNNNDYNYFIYEINENSYVRNIETFKENLEKRSKVIKSTIQINENKINALNSILSGSSSVESNEIPKTIMDLSLENVELKSELDYITSALNNATYDDKFNNEVDSLVNGLMEYKKEIEEAFKVINHEITLLRYDNNSVVTSEGRSLGLNLALAFLGTIFVMFGIVFVTTYFDHKKQLTKIKE